MAAETNEKISLTGSEYDQFTVKVDGRVIKMYEDLSHARKVAIGWRQSGCFVEIIGAKYVRQERGGVVSNWVEGPVALDEPHIAPEVVEPKPLTRAASLLNKEITILTDLYFPEPPKRENGYSSAVGFTLKAYDHDPSRFMVCMRRVSVTRSEGDREERIHRSYEAISESDVAAISAAISAAKSDAILDLTTKKKGGRKK